MKMSGLVLVVLGVAAWTFNECFYRTVDTVGMLQERMFFPLSRLTILIGLVLLVLHFAYYAVMRIFWH